MLDWQWSDCSNIDKNFTKFSWNIHEIYMKYSQKFHEIFTSNTITWSSDNHHFLFHYIHFIWQAELRVRRYIFCTTNVYTQCMTGSTYFVQVHIFWGNTTHRAFTMGVSTCSSNTITCSPLFSLYKHYMTGGTHFVPPYSQAKEYPWLL